MPSERLYPLSTVSWGARRASEIIHISTPDDRVIGRFPVQFVFEGGDNTWGFIIHVIQILIDYDAQFPSVILDANGSPVDNQSAPTQGRFVYEQPGQCLQENIFHKVSLQITKNPFPMWYRSN